jgi:hypothetical protein
VRRLLACLALLLAASTAEAKTELEAAVGLGGSKSDWRGDGAAASTLKAGLRFNDVFMPYFLGRLGYGTVDTRMLTLVSVGAEISQTFGDVRPYLRFSLDHQHEEAVQVVRGDPVEALFGIGDGIRHRGGVEGAIGLDLPIQRNEDIGVFASFETSATWFFDPRGPHWYVGGTALLGLSYEL